MQHFKQTLNIRSIKRTLNASSKSLIIRFYLIISYNEPVPPSPFVDENCHFVANSYSRQQWSMLITFFRKSRFPNNLDRQKFALMRGSAQKCKAVSKLNFTLKLLIAI